MEAAIEEGPPIQVAWREVEDRGVWWFLTEESDRFGEAARPDNLNTLHGIRCATSQPVKSEPSTRSSRVIVQRTEGCKVRTTSARVSALRMTMLSCRA